MNIVNKDNKKVAIYVRVSSLKQAQTGYSISSQTRRLKQYCKLKDWLIYNIYTDDGYSAGSTNRPAFQQMLNDSREHKFDIILFNTLDRFSRSMRDFVLTISDLIEDGINIACLDQNMDTTTPSGKLFAHILMSFAEWERDLIKRRVEKTMLEKAELGLPISIIPYGFKAKKRNGKVVSIEINKAQAEIIKEVFKLTAEGGNWKEICEKLNINTSKYYRILQNKLYIGIVEFKGEDHPLKIPGIISREVFDQVKEQLDQRSYLKKPKIKKYKTELSVTTSP